MSIKRNPSHLDKLYRTIHRRPFAFLFKTAQASHDLKLEHVAADDTVDISRPNIYRTCNIPRQSRWTTLWTIISIAIQLDPEWLMLLEMQFAKSQFLRCDEEHRVVNSIKLNGRRRLLMMMQVINSQLLCHR